MSFQLTLESALTIFKPIYFFKKKKKKKRKPKKKKKKKKKFSYNQATSTFIIY